MNYTTDVVIQRGLNYMALYCKYVTFWGACSYLPYKLAPLVLPSILLLNALKKPLTSPTLHPCRILLSKVEMLSS